MGELTGTLPQTVWQELTHKLMLAEAKMKHGISGGNPAARLAGKPEIVRNLSLYRTKMQALVNLGLRFERCEQGCYAHTSTLTKHNQRTGSTPRHS